MHIPAGELRFHPAAVTPPELQDNVVNLCAIRTKIFQRVSRHADRRFKHFTHDADAVVLHQQQGLLPIISPHKQFCARECFAHRHQ